MLGQIHNVLIWKLNASGTCGEPEELIAFVDGVVEALCGWRRAPQNDRYARTLTSQHCEIPGGVSKPVILFVGGIVLLIDDKDAWIPERYENG